MPEKNDRSWSLSAIFLALLFFAIPIEHKYDKLFRHYSLTLIPDSITLPSQFDPKIYFYLSDLLGIVLLIIGLIKIRKNDQEKGALLLLFLFCSAALSIAASPFVHLPIAYIRLLQFLTPLSLCFFLVHSSLSKKQIFKIASLSIFSAALIQSFLAVIQYFSQQSLGLRIIGEQPLNSFINVSGGYRWLPDQWTHRLAADPVIYRAMGTMSHANMLGGLLAVSLLITVYFFAFHRKYRICLAPAYLIQLFALGITYSRSAIFAYLIGALVWLAWMRLRCKIVLTGTLALIICSGSIVGVLLSRQILQRGGVVNTTELSRASDQERLYYQDIAMRMIEKHPLMGIGYGQFAIRMPSYLPQGADPSIESGNTAVHNIFLLLATENGLPSLIIFLCWIGLILWSGWRTREHLAETGLLFSAWTALLFIGCCDLYPIFMQQGKLLFFGIAGCLGKFGFYERFGSLQPDISKV